MQSNFNAYLDIIFKQINGFDFKQNKRNIKYKNNIFYYSISKDIYFLLDEENNVILNEDKSIMMSFGDVVRSFLLTSSEFNGMNIFDFVNFLEKEKLFNGNLDDSNINDILNNVNNKKLGKYLTMEEKKQMVLNEEQVPICVGKSNFNKGPVKYYSRTLKKKMKL